MFSQVCGWVHCHRSMSQEHLPLHLGCFEFVHIVPRRGRALFGALLTLLLAPYNESPPHKRHSFRSETESLSQDPG